MSVELLALTAALCYALGHIAIKFGSQGGAMISGFLVSLVAGSIGLAIAAQMLLSSWSTPDLAVAMFAFAGVAGPGLGRLLAMRGVRDAGASVSAPIQASANPALSSLAGVLLFGEVIGPGRGVALVLIIGGVFACARGGSANREGTLAARGRWVLVWPVAAGAAFAGADVLRKYGLNEGGEPLLGALLGVVTALVLWCVIVLASPRLRGEASLHRSQGWYALYGVLSALGLAALLSALQGGELSVVIPIFAFQPVLVVLLSALLLRRFEQLRVGTVVGATVAFGGVTLLALG